jgi:hypothetical protein
MVRGFAALLAESLWLSGRHPLKIRGYASRSPINSGNLVTSSTNTHIERDAPHVSHLQILTRLLFNFGYKRSLAGFSQRQHQRNRL